MNNFCSKKCKKRETNKKYNQHHFALAIIWKLHTCNRPCSTAVPPQWQRVPQEVRKSHNWTDQHTRLHTQPANCCPQQALPFFKSNCFLRQFPAICFETVLDARFSIWKAFWRTRFSNSLKAFWRKRFQPESVFSVSRSRMRVGQSATIVFGPLPPRVCHTCSMVAFAHYLL